MPVDPANTNKLSINIFVFTNWNKINVIEGSSRLDNIKGQYNVAVVTAMQLHWYLGQGQIQDLQKEGAQWLSGAHCQDFCGQFRGLFKEFGAKRGRRAPPPPLDPRL